MQFALAADYPELEIDILGVNGAGYESGNDLACEGNDIPWLQDTLEADWWGSWNPTYRDMIILDGEGALAAVYNLTDKPVTTDANYDELYALLVELAQQ
ncbi:hypothetical protein G6O69_34175 [Pseudenhygromyxa sp. WMMC2535]|uniref:hypothetical protein n=1 Tax=Pseudenhygromyxa sp. WMMC2535 TaxID=2712867 RepID=UPI0015572208|nr:hypothetical protein [Pseudenhygromyxa sp. WMMC2535]NVB42919.1 hypothetical protein [Pseudenhygromyxa sp. WMMC2535]